MTTKSDFLPADDENIDEIIEMIREFLPRLIRGVAYALVATLLLWTNDYGINQPRMVACAIGTLGLFTSSARIGQFGLLVLMFMAVVPKEFLLSLIG